MASPFRIFRKHQRVMIVVLGVLAMGAFVVIPAALEWLRSSQGPQGGDDPVWVTSDLGTLRESDVQDLSSNWTGLARGALSDMASTVAMKAYFTQLQHEQLNTEEFAERMASIRIGPMIDFTMNILALKPPKNISIQGIIRGQPIVGKNSMTTKDAADLWLLARYAESRGIQVDSNIILATLAELSGGQITNEDIKRALNGRAMSERAFFQAMGDPVLVYRLKQMQRLEKLSPAQIRDYYARTRQAAEAEIALIDIVAMLDDAEFIKSLGEPTDDELEALFEEYKDKDAMPGTAEFGFHQPHELAFQYITVTPEMLDAWPGITEEMIQSYYEKNRPRFEEMLRNLINQQMQSQMPPAGMGSPTDGAPTDPATGAPADATTDPTTDAPADATTEPAVDAPADATTEPAVDAPADTTTDAPADATTEPAVDAPADTTTDAPADATTEPVEETPADTTTDTPVDTTEPVEETPDSSDTSSIFLPGPFFLTSMLQETATDDTATDTTEDAAVDTTADTTEPAAADTTEPAPVDATTETAPETPAVEPVAEPDATPAEPATDTANPYTVPIGPALPPVDAPPVDAPPETSTGINPLIRPRVVREVTLVKLQEVIQKIKDDFERYRGERSVYEFQKNESADAELPVYPDVAAIIAPYGLEYRTTRLLPQWLFEAIPAGESYEWRQNEKPPIGMKMSDYFYDESSTALIPVESVGREDRYLSWIVREELASTPEFADPGVREKVIKAWLMKKAREKAAEKAKELAEKARESGKPLAEVFATAKDVKVETPLPFKWLSAGAPNAFGRMTYDTSRVMGVDNPGEDFMAVVFDELSKENPVGTAMNKPETQACVIRLISVTPEDFVVDQSFLIPEEQGRFRSDIGGIVQGDLIDLQDRWVEAIKKQADFKWYGPTRDSLDDSNIEPMPTDIDLKEMESKHTAPTE